jgi:hypothetical protein
MPEPRAIPWTGILLLVTLASGACRNARSNGGGSPAEHSMTGIRLEDLTWIQAERALTADTVVVIPIGAASKEHGPIFC